MSNEERNIMYANYKNLIKVHLNTAKNLIDQAVELQKRMKKDSSSEEWLKPIIESLFSNIKNLLEETRQLFDSCDKLISSYRG